MGQFLMTFKDYPQRQKAASFNLDEVMQKLKEAGEVAALSDTNHLRPASSTVGRSDTSDAVGDRV